jgi:hypothetical protein
MLVCKVSLGKARLSWFYKNKYCHFNIFSHRLLNLKKQKASWGERMKKILILQIVKKKLMFCQALLHFSKIQGKGISSSRQNSKCYPNLDYKKYVV